ncbi:L,D-transpeptidase family protein [Chitinophaga ginsengisoli]|uniref:Murein L,D-transpeptidase YcbB/YkuD n=1 Tax=Chitinophaga ginsengisoli TaxID=363837 RepID=A0A2P8GCT9_9BACT|nr:L,D-transpeptidase family protein [Chitinophaga ginsengisoli]PSL31767.1 murein L,D-transpeptidase YcbB/YkuD [Chitinophaga ginsengisoli]
MKYRFLRDNLTIALVLFSLFACHRKRVLREKEIVKDVRQLSEVIPENIAERLEYIVDNEDVMEDSVPALRGGALTYFYQQTSNNPVWSSEGVLDPQADSLLFYVSHADESGLNPAIYHNAALAQAMKRLKEDDAARKDAALWAQVDVLMTDAFMKMASHLRFGIAPRDSITLRRDSVYSDTLLANYLTTALHQHIVGATLRSQEPQQKGYEQLKSAWINFKGKYSEMKWDSLPVSYTDTPAFRQQLINRLAQSGHLDTSGGHGADTAILKKGIRAFQKEFNMYEDGQAGKKTVQALNKTFRDWSAQVAVNMDRWRKLPDTLPERFIMVNVPGYRMELWDSGSVALTSKIIVGAPRTRTPLLNSRMTNFIMYPYWRVPFSITIKEMLPAIKRDRAYLAKKSLEIIDRDGNAINPDSVNWSRMSKNYFPYVLRQMDGLENSLGIMKFNFMNKYAVYLHDTNNRGLFSNAYRALSHGCVRVQQWDSLAMYLTKGDARHPRDSMRMWLANGNKKQIDIQRSVPIYLRYFTAEGRDGRIVFHEDIYGEDKVLRKIMGM